MSFENKFYNDVIDEEYIDAKQSDNNDCIKKENESDYAFIDRTIHRSRRC